MSDPSEFHAQLKRDLPSQLPAFLAQQRWFGGKARQIRSVKVVDSISIADSLQNIPSFALLIYVAVDYASGPAETYAIPLLCSRRDASAREHDSTILQMETNDGSVIFRDALKDESFLRTLLGLIQREAVLPGGKSELRAWRTTAFASLSGSHVDTLIPKPVRAEQSNTSVIYGDRLILKVFRRVEEGVNPDLEVGNFLTERAHFAHVPSLAGAMECRGADGHGMTQAILQAFVPNQGDAWRYTLQCLGNFYQKISHQPDTLPIPRAGKQSPNSAEQVPLGFARESLDSYLTAAELLGKRTAELHLALSCDESDPAFTPESFTSEFQEAIHQSLKELMAQVFDLLDARMQSLPEEWRSPAQDLLGRKSQIAKRFATVLDAPIHATRTRIHGDFHLGQVLYTGSDFVIIDFEGEPARPLAERRLKRSPLQDVAGMLRSFHYAALAPFFLPVQEKGIPDADVKRLHPWAEAWVNWVTNRFLAEYLQTAGNARFLPADAAQRENLLWLHQMEKAIYELGYELNNRPGWVGVPLQGIAQLI